MTMKLIVISGRSGSGKSTALHQLEDQGYYCVDNLPAGLLPMLLEQLEQNQYAAFKGIAVCIDARNSPHDLGRIRDVLDNLPSGIRSEVLFLDAQDAILTKRFSETRRRHPLTNNQLSLSEAIHAEIELLEALSSRADLVIDTSDLNLYDLRAVIDQYLGSGPKEGMSVLVESFGFKRGVPLDADLIFDARLLPNPHWVSGLRHQTGQDDDVIAFLESHPQSHALIADIVAFLERWLPEYHRSQRSYVTVAIGCTGGQHRSVYVAERLFARLEPSQSRLQIRHRELARQSSP